MDSKIAIIEHEQKRWVHQKLLKAQKTRSVNQEQAKRWSPRAGTDTGVSYS
jgi:hypothetical protein